MKLHLLCYLFFFFTLSSCQNKEVLIHNKHMMPSVLANVVRQYHKRYPIYKTNVYWMRFMNEYDTNQFIVLPILNRGQMQRVTSFKLFKVDSLFVLCSTGYELFEEQSTFLKADSMNLVQFLDSFMLPAPFDPPIWRGIIFSKDSILIDKEPKNPYGIDPPCETTKSIKFIPPDKVN